MASGLACEDLVGSRCDSSPVCNVTVLVVTFQVNDDTGDMQ